MINNIQDLFIKYKSKINSKKEIENKILLILKESIGLDLKNKNLMIDLKNKRISIINTNSIIKFYLKSKIEQDLINFIKKETDYNLDI